MRTKNLFYTSLALTSVVGAGYYLYRRNRVKPHGIVSDEVGAKLPIAKDLNTVADNVGNYDIDGVSFDTEGVIVASDNLKGNEATI